MKSIKQNILFAIALMLLIVGSTLYVEYKTTFFESDVKLALQEKKIYLVEKLEYKDSFIIPTITSIDDFNAQLDKDPTAAIFDIQTIANTITQEANDSFKSNTSNPLPLLAHWNIGDVNYIDENNSEGMTPDYILNLIENGNYILPSWRLERLSIRTLPDDYYKDSILRAKELNLPLTFIIDPLESTFINDSYYFTLSAEENPNVVDASSNILEKVSPFGNNELWSLLGKNNAINPLLQLIQEWYPNPPLVMFVDNKNENKLSWNEVNTSKRYVDGYGYDKDDIFKRTLIGAQWIEKYRLLHEAFKNNLISDAWKANTKFVSYNPNTLDIGSSDFWHFDSTITNNFFSVWPETTDASNTALHIDGSIESLNKAIFNSNNIPFVRNEANKTNIDFSYQLSISDSNSLYTQEQYRGYAQLALWLTRPNIIRELNSETNDKNITMSNYQALIDSVQLIHNDTILQDFWKNGKLVVNYNLKTTQFVNVPLVYENSDKWFLLDVDVNPNTEWNESSDIPVYAIALETGVEPNREWLVYVQSPNAILENIIVTLPGYSDIDINSSVNGNFYIVGENGEEQVTPVNSLIANTNIIDLEYLEEVIIPEYNPNDDTHVLINENNGNWNEKILNDPLKKHFYVEPGVYNSSYITLRIGGTIDDRRTISLYNGNDTHPAALPDNEVANVLFHFSKGANYWTIDRMANLDREVNPSMRFMNGASHNIINRWHLRNFNYGIKIYADCNENTIQNSYINHATDNARRTIDAIAIGLFLEGDTEQTISGTKIINNDIRNGTDGFQLIWGGSGTDSSNCNFEGTIFDSNRIWMDSDSYCDSLGNSDINGQYMIAENAIDLKSGSNNASNPVVITNNIIWGYKTRYPKFNTEAAISTHYGVKNTIINDNILTDIMQGINIISMDSSSEINNNIFHNIASENPKNLTVSAIYLSSSDSVTISNSTIVSNIESSLGGGYAIYIHDAALNATVYNTVLISTSDTRPNSDSNIYNTWYYEHEETTLGGVDEKFYTFSEKANMQDYTFYYEVFTTNKKQKTIPNIVISENSPHFDLAK